MAEDLTGAIFRDPSIRSKASTGGSSEDRVKPVEIDWKRKDGTILKVRLSERETRGQRGKIDGHEVIAENVTNQRKLEDSLRNQASKDSLTGLANYRHFIDVSRWRNKAIGAHGTAICPVIVRLGSAEKDK